MRSIVHEDGEPKLATANQEQRQDNRQNVRPDGNQGKRRKNDQPVEAQRKPTPPVSQNLEFANFIGAKHGPPVSCLIRSQHC